MDTRSQSLWEFVLLLAVVAGIFIWLDFKKQTETNNIASGAKQDNVTNKKFALINDISFLNWHSGPKASSPETVAPKPIISVPVVAPVEPTLTESLGIPREQVESIGRLSPLERLGLDIVVILVVMVLGGLLDAVGGAIIIELRRYAMPVLVCAGVSTITYSFFPVWYSWLAGLMVLPACGTLTLPYRGDGNFGRGLWLFINAIAFGLFLTLYSIFFHVPLLVWWMYLIYIVIAGIWGGIYRNWEQFLGDWITGSFGLCSIIFWVFLSLQFKL